MNSVTRWLAPALAAAVLQARAADPWRHIDKANEPLLPGDEIQFVKRGMGADEIWIGMLGGAVKVQAGVLRPLEPARKLNVWDITERPQGGIWIGHGEGALLVDGERTVKTLQGHTVGSIQAVGAQLWAVAGNSVLQADGESWIPVPAFKDRRVADLLRDSKGTFWLVLDGDGVIEIDPGKRPEESRHHLPMLNVTSVMTDSKGRTWCGLWDGGVMMRRNGEWERHLGGERSAVLAMAEAGDGRIWAATSGNGVWTYDGENWSGMLQEEGAVNLLKATSDGRVWISTQQNGGLRYWNGKEWKVSLEGPMPQRCLTELPGGALLAGGVHDGLHVLGDYNIKGE
ncbi:MAG: hypothetical protein FJ225_09130 [Lentisphaerae bacterium]|nr:hypothetical protein [Lentisphaerota bacterium]